MKTVKNWQLIKDIKHLFEKTAKDFYLFTNRLRVNVNLKKEESFYKLVLSERFKGHIKWFKYILVFVGLFSSLLIFSSILYGFIFALFLFLVQTIIENTLFSYTSLYIQPLPNFKLEPERWLGMSFGFAEAPDKSIRIPLIGMLFNDKDYAHKIYNLILSWNYGDRNDLKGNINASVILHDSQQYTFFVYPSPSRKTVKKFFGSVEKKRKKTSFTDIHWRMFIQLVLGRGCKITSDSYLPRFISQYRSGIPIHFQILLYENGKAGKTDDLEDIIIYNLKIKKIKDLTRKDIEHEIFKIRKP